MERWQERNDLVLARVREDHPDLVQEVGDFRGELTLVVTPEQVYGLCQYLRDDPALPTTFWRTSSPTICSPNTRALPSATTSIPLPHNHRVRVRALVEDPDEGPQTLGDLWPIATWLETEVWDLMGIRFQGNDKLRRLFLPEDWQGHPLRKDYPLGYEQVQFSFNWKAIGVKKPHPQE
jgi:NADH-quinone oxidoreductase subunit C